MYFGTGRDPLRRARAPKAIVDTSAIVAVLREQEDDAPVYARAIAAAATRRLSAASYLECGIVLDSQRDPIVSSPQPPPTTAA